MVSIQVSTAIIAIVEAIKKLFPQVTGVITILTAAILGLLAGFAKIDDLNWLSGIITGLVSVGVIKTAQTVSGKQRTAVGLYKQLFYSLTFIEPKSEAGFGLVFHYLRYFLGGRY